MPTTGANTVTIINYVFTPTTLNITVGTKVTWINTDAVEHTATSDLGLFDGDLPANGGSYSFTFTSAGLYTYHCSLHTYMTGQIVVR